MRIVVHGQQAFGKAVLEALLKRGENVIAVYVAPEESAKADPLKEAALAASLPVHQPASYRKPSLGGIQGAQARPAGDGFRHAVRAGDFLNVPTHGSIQYHPSLLPKYRGPSAINWPIIQGDTETGLSVFWPDNGLDTGDVLLQKKTRRSAGDSLGTVYFDRLFPMKSRPCWRRSTWSRPAKARASSRITGGPPMRAAAAARTMPASTGASPGGRSATSSAAAILRSGVDDAERVGTPGVRSRSRCPRAIPRASPARWARSSRSRPTASPWSAPTDASRFCA